MFRGTPAADDERDVSICGSTGSEQLRVSAHLLELANTAEPGFGEPDTLMPAYTVTVHKTRGCKHGDTNDLTRG